MENPKHSFRETNLALQVIEELQFKSDKLEFAKDLCFISMYSVLNTLPQYTYLYYKKDITSHTFIACF